ncbi:ATP-binding protein [Gemmatimonas sp.]|uniref:ATP-binding protein n=1 Tax=Gemmatimonas sp. TaxID=1962908 RepID=UPI003982F1CA
MTEPSDSHAERILALSPLTLDRLGDIRQFLRETLADLGCAGVTDAIVLAVDEVCANLVEHATDGLAPGPTRVSVRRSGDDAIIVVEDRGQPFDPADAPAPDLVSDWIDRPIGGLGWFLVKQMVDDLSYDSVSSAQGMLNRLTLIKRGAASASSSGPV